MGLNTIRLEGKLESQQFFDLADRKGDSGDGWMVLLRFLGALAKWKPQDYKIAESVLARSDLSLASHPSLLVVAERQ